MPIRGVIWPLLAAGAIAAALLWWTHREPILAYGAVYAYDTGTGELYVTSETVPPMSAPSGPEAGVKAEVVRFAGDRLPTVVYLTTYTPSARRSLDSAGYITPEVIAGTLVRRPGDSMWVVASSPAGQAIVTRISELAEGRSWTVALPPAAVGGSR